MNKEKKLLKNTVIIGIGKICTSLITFLLLPLYTGVLSTSEYGIVDLLTTLVSLLIPIITLKLEDALFRRLIDYRTDEEKTKKIISTAIITIMLQIISFVFIFLIIQCLINNEYKFFLLSNVIIYIILSFLQQTARGLGKITEFSIGSFISAVSTIIFNILLLVVIPMHAYGMLLGTFLGQFIACIYFAIKINIIKYIDLKAASKSLLKNMLKYSIPLIPNALSWWIFSASDRVIVSYIMGVDFNGILAASLKFSSVIIILYNIFDMSWIESVSSNINENDFEKYFNKMFNIIFNFFASICLLAIVVMPIVYPIMINEKFSFGYVLVPITLISSIFNVGQGMVAVVYAAKNNTKSLAKTSVASAIVNIIIHLSLISYIGLFAAVISTLVSMLSLFIYRIVDIRRKYIKISINTKLVLLYIIILAICLLCYYTNNIYLNIISMIIGILYFVLSNKNTFKTITGFVLKKIKVK
ncbi:MAG: hypothetical protein E7159_01545 [Firmicutes bacterium]|nr:hypothetical protein [Bacillota bacterium]